MPSATPHKCTATAKADDSCAGSGTGARSTSPRASSSAACKNAQGGYCTTSLPPSPCSSEVTRTSMVPGSNLLGGDPITALTVGHRRLKRPSLQAGKFTSTLKISVIWPRAEKGRKCVSGHLSWLQLAGSVPWEPLGSWWHTFATAAPAEVSSQARRQLQPWAPPGLQQACQCERECVWWTAATSGGAP